MVLPGSLCFLKERILPAWEYVGFHAVESIKQDENTEVVVVRETGNVGWISERVPEKVMVNAVEVTEQVQREGELYTISLPEEPSKMVLSIVFSSGIISR